MLLSCLWKTEGNFTAMFLSLKLKGDYDKQDLLQVDHNLINRILEICFPLHLRMAAPPYIIK